MREGRACANGCDEQEIENLETLTSIEQLWLGKNKIAEIKVRELNISARSTCSRRTC